MGNHGEEEEAWRACHREGQGQRTLSGNHGQNCPPGGTSLMMHSETSRCNIKEWILLSICVEHGGSVLRCVRQTTVLTLHKNNGSDTDCDESMTGGRGTSEPTKQVDLTPKTQT